jgi:hypothetical protein
VADHWPRGRRGSVAPPALARTSSPAHLSSLDSRSHVAAAGGTPTPSQRQRGIFSCGAASSGSSGHRRPTCPAPRPTASWCAPRAPRPGEGYRCVAIWLFVAVCVNTCVPACWQVSDPPTSLAWARDCLLPLLRATVGPASAGVKRQRDRFPVLESFSQAAPLRWVVQEPGDIVYVPHGCFHAVLNIEARTFPAFSAPAVARARQARHVTLTLLRCCCKITHRRRWLGPRT